MKPEVNLAGGREKRALGGHPWIYSNEIDMSSSAKALPPGSVVVFRDAQKRPAALGFFNPHSLIAGRVLTRNIDREINRSFLAERIEQASALRRRLCYGDFARMVHAEADRLPGLILDGLGPVLVMQCNSAGMDRLRAEIQAAVEDVFQPEILILRNDAPARAQEGLDSETAVLRGQWKGPVEIVENDCRYFADPMGGQKTGWYFDQRENRALIAGLCQGARVLDLYCHSGGFAVLAAKSGAREVTAIDTARGALELGARAASANGVDSICRFEKGDVFDTCEKRLAEKQRFDVVIADPPPFARSRRDLEVAAKAYRKLGRLAAGLVAPGGFLFIASCSHNMPADRFLSEVNRGIGLAGRSARILAQTGAAMDHPVHPLLAETAYLKALLLALD